MPRSGEPHLGRARSLYERAHAENLAGRPAAAARTLQRAINLLESATPDEAGESQLLTARVLLRLAWSVTQLSGPERGLALLDDVLVRISDHAAGASVRTALHNQWALLLWRAGSADNALQQFALAEQWFEHTTPNERYSVLLNRATIRMDRLALAEARADLQAAVAIAAESGMKPQEHMARHNLGWLEFLAGDLPRALALMDEDESVSASFSGGVRLLDRARVLVEAGLSRDADEALAEAAEILRHDRMTYERAEALLARAHCALREGELARARTFAVQARQLFRRRGNRRWESMCRLAGLGADIGLGRSGPALVDEALELSQALSECDLPTESRTAKLLAGELMLREGDLAGGRQAVGEAGALRSEDRISLRLHSRYMRARIEAASGDRSRAVAQIRQGFAELTDYQAKFGSLDLQAASSLHGQRLANLDMSIALELGSAVQVFAAAERARALSSRLPAVRPPADEKAAGMLSELRQIIESLRAVDVDPKALAELRRRRGFLERQIKARHWTVAGSGTPQRPVTLRHVRDALAEDHAELVIFLYLRGSLHGLVIGPTRSQVVSLGSATPVVELTRRIRADLDVLAMGRLPELLRESARSSLQRALKQVDELVLRPLRLNDGPLIVAPSGVLGALPWTTIPRLRGKPVTVIQSATSWLAVRCAESHRQDGNNGAAWPQTVAVAGPALNRAVHEVHAVAKNWPDCVTLTGDDATGMALRGALREARIVHVAAHGQHEPDNPLFSCIRLADGPLFGYDLVGDIGAGVHVVLSACELGLATIRPGEEALGLTRALLHHGAATVVSGVARVADDVAEQVMSQYHQLLSHGQPPAEALATATEGRLDAPFVCFGSGLSRVPGIPSY